ncbi:MAG TPA: hypothetical protein VM238_03135 [Phycisphaerae bacterium]|nr:hypothetical protein [Phycisphaerae bacterium]
MGITDPTDCLFSRYDADLSPAIDLHPVGEDPVTAAPQLYRVILCDCPAANSAAEARARQLAVPVLCWLMFQKGECPLSRAFPEGAGERPDNRK